MSDYSQWRGPARDGLSPETGLLTSWPTGGPSLLWKRDDVGYGYGAPSVAGGGVFLIASEGVEKEFVHALDARTGKPLGKTMLGKVGNPDQQPSFPGARSTPTIDGKSLYALSSDGDLACVETATGKVVWTKNLRTDFGGVPGVWAYAESPLVHGDRVIVTPGGPEASLVALDKNNGKTLWKTKTAMGEKGAAYSSAVIGVGMVQRSTRAPLIVQFLSKGLVGVLASDGRVQWTSNGTVDRSYGVQAQTPVILPGPGVGSLVYSAAGNRGAAIDPPSSRGGWKPVGEGALPKTLWELRDAPCGLGGTVLYRDHLYGTNQRELVCVEAATGKLAWSNPCIGPASVCVAEGMLYVHGEGGDMALVEATKLGYKERGRFTPSQRPERLRGPMERAWAYPVVADKKLYIREGSTLWCYDLKK